MARKHHVSRKRSHKHNHDGPGHCDAAPAPTAETDTGIPAGNLTWHVAGMDCASCAITITTTLERLPGTSDIKISLMHETLSLHLDEQQTTPRTIEKTIASLGYKTTPLHTESATQEIPDTPWWQTEKGMAVILSGVLLAAAFLVSRVLPQWSVTAFALATLFALAPVASHAFSALKNGSFFTIEMLVTIAAIGALFIHAAEEAAIVVFLFCIGELLEGVATRRARAGIKALGQLAPKTAWREQNGLLKQTDVAQLAIGDIILARPGDRIAADSLVLEGQSSVNEAPVTGESLPRSKEKDDTVFAGSINLEAPLRLRVEKNTADNTISRIIKLVETAEAAKAPTERFIDRFTRIYMPIIVCIAILAAIIPPLVTGADWSTWLYRALALLLIGCPCALVISVPAAIASSLAAGTRHGLLIKGGQVIETLAKIRTIAFDKTGTLTKGTPVVTDVIAFTGKADRLLGLASGIERESNHPLATAIVAHAQTAGIAAHKVKNIHAIAGKGMAATGNGKTVFIGAPRFAAEYGTINVTQQAEIDRLENSGKTVVMIMIAGKAAGLVALADEPREEARQTIDTLHRLGIRTLMMTGDNKRAAAAISEKLGITAQAELLPEMKAAFIEKQRQEQPVAMVGDGINDAPALAAANAGIAMGEGTDVALETADAALLRNRIYDVAGLVTLAQATMRNIRQNITIALGLKLIFLLTTLLGLTGLWPAIFADTGATVLVTLNALRLLAFSPHTPNP